MGREGGSEAGRDEAGRLGRGPHWAPVLREKAVVGHSEVPVWNRPRARKD